MLSRGRRGRSRWMKMMKTKMIPKKKKTKKKKTEPPNSDNFYEI